MMIRANRSSHWKQAMIKKLNADQSGVTAIEFAITAPVFFILMLGGMNLAQMAYGQAMLNGSVQDAARFSGLETGDTTAADEFVEKSIAAVLPGVEITYTRDNYFDFADIGRAEPLGDINGNGECDPGETFGDENDNDIWDESVAISGNGGANDIVVYTVTATYVPMFSVPLIDDSLEEKTLTAKSVRKNQPFAIQANRTTRNVAC